ncbi:MAG: histidine ammonia-lyase [Elusimicrobia bacterium]|nr:histidine ammonia-lyase [Elusimicrobiota bacterium]
MKPFILGGLASLSDLVDVAASGRRVLFGPKQRARVRATRGVVDRAAASDKPCRGVNTGFGDLAGVAIPKDDLGLLQRNLVLSHAAGVGEPLDAEEARGMLFLRANELSRGYAGCRPQVPDLMARLLNAGVVPVVPSRGSVGAGGDLAPLAHMALALLGEGEVVLRGRRLPAREALKRLGLKPLALEAKEGLSLLSGTQAMQSVGGLALYRAFHVLGAAQIAGAMSLEAMAGSLEPFEATLHDLKPHFGQNRTAERTRRLVSGSQILRSCRDGEPRPRDPASLRCIPQVHGAAGDVLANAMLSLTTEMASITDDPVVAENRILSGGNANGQHLGLAYDGAAAALAVLANISERRVFRLLHGPAPGLKAFLARDPGLETGWMLAQSTAAALASENKALAHPSSCDSLPTSTDEDFAGMGVGAALKLKRVVWNTAQVVAIELLCAARGVESRAPLKPGRGVGMAMELLRARARRPFAGETLGSTLEKAREFVLSGGLVEVLS